MYGPAPYVYVNVYSNRTSMTMQTDMSGQFTLSKMNGFQAGDMISLQVRNSSTYYDNSMNTSFPYMTSTVSMMLYRKQSNDTL
jgi:phage tail tube protein FII